MLENHVSAKITRKRLNSGPAANHINDFSDWLYARGYKKRSLFRMLQSFAAWTDWLTKTGRAAEDFSARISFLIHNSETSERDNRQCL